MRRGKHHQVIQLAQVVTGERVHLCDLLHLVAEQRNSYHGLLVCGVDLDCVPLDPELPATERHVVPFVLHVDQLAQHRPLLDHGSPFEYQQLPLIVLGRPESVDT